MRIDSARCEGHGRCYALYDDLFDCDDDGRGIVRPVVLDEALRPRARKAVSACPERAVEIIRNDVTGGDLA